MITKKLIFYKLLSYFITELAVASCFLFFDSLRKEVKEATLLDIFLLIYI